MLHGSDAREELRIGDHIVRFEPPDLLLNWLVGDESLAEAQAFVRCLRSFAETRERVFVLTDISRLGTVSPEARKYLSIETNIPKLRGIAVIGGSFAQRAMSKLVLKAMDILGRGTMAPTRLFESEAQARAWLQQRRRDAT